MNSEWLFEAIGYTDDDILAQAETYRSGTKRGYGRLAKAAAVFLAVLLLGAGGAYAAGWFGTKAEIRTSPTKITLDGKDSRYTFGPGLALTYEGEDKDEPVQKVFCRLAVVPDAAKSDSTDGMMWIPWQMGCFYLTGDASLLLEGEVQILSDTEEDQLHLIEAQIPEVDGRPSEQYLIQIDDARRIAVVVRGHLDMDALKEILANVEIVELGEPFEGYDINMVLINLGVG